MARISFQPIVWRSRDANPITFDTQVATSLIYNNKKKTLIDDEEWKDKL